MTEKVPNLHLRTLADARDTTLFDLAAGRTIVAGNCAQHLLFILKLTFFTKLYRFLDNSLRAVSRRLDETKFVCRGLRKFGRGKLNNIFSFFIIGVNMFSGLVSFHLFG
jgi:hypothetical protein